MTPRYNVNQVHFHFNCFYFYSWTCHFFGKSIFAIPHPSPPPGTAYTRVHNINQVILSSSPLHTGFKSFWELEFWENPGGQSHLYDPLVFLQTRSELHASGNRHSFTSETTHVSHSVYNKFLQVKFQTNVTVLLLMERKRVAMDTKKSIENPCAGRL